MATPRQPSIKTCDCMDIVTMTPVKCSCQSIKVPTCRRPFISTSGVLQTRCSSSSSLFLLIRRLLVTGSPLKSSSLLTKWTIKAWAVRAAGSPVSRSQRLKVSLLQSAIDSWCCSLLLCQRDSNVVPKLTWATRNKRASTPSPLFARYLLPHHLIIPQLSQVLHATNLNQSISRLNKPCSDIRSLSVFPLC